MAHQEIIDRAMRIVRNKLDSVNGDHADISKDELVHIATALAVASILCRANNERNGR